MNEPTLREALRIAELTNAFDSINLQMDAWKTTWNDYEPTTAQEAIDYLQASLAELLDRMAMIVEVYSPANQDIPGHGYQDGDPA